MAILKLQTAARDIMIFFEVYLKEIALFNKILYRRLDRSGAEEDAISAICSMTSLPTALSTAHQYPHMLTPGTVIELTYREVSTGSPEKSDEYLGLLDWKETTPPSPNTTKWRPSKKPQA